MSAGGGVVISLITQTVEIKNHTNCRSWCQVFGEGRSFAERDLCLPSRAVPSRTLPRGVGVL